LKNISDPKLLTILDLAKEAHSFMNTEKCIDSILNRVSDILDTELGSIMLLDEKTKELFIKKAMGFNGEIVKKTRIKIGEGIAGWVAKTGEPLLIRDLSKDKRFKQYKKKDVKRYTTDSLLSVPIRVGDKVIGVINVNNKKTKRVFGKHDLAVLAFIADQVGLAIQNARAHEETRRQADIKLDFISNVSHELKNPLAIVKDSISLIADGFTGAVDKKKADILNIAIRNIDRLNRMLTSLLDLAKLEAGKAVVKRSYIDLKKLIDETVDFFNVSARASGVKMKVNFLLKYHKIWADWDKMTQVMNNLINNSLKFTPKGGEIDIIVKEKDGKVLITIQDSGVGMKKSDLPRLFNKFERVGDPKSKVKGTGLGLVICKEIVNIHRGEIWADSRLHKGTKFFVSLPRDLRKEERYG